MEKEDLLELALEFFGLDTGFSEEEFKNRYRELAKKYHPDSSEFTSPILFNELMRSKTVLENYLEEKKTTLSFEKKREANSKNQNQESTRNPNNQQESQPEQFSQSKKDEAYELYKIAKEIENEAILEYFEKTKGNPVFLEADQNPPLRRLLEKLERPLQNYKRIIRDFPRSIWVADAEDSIRRINVWLFGGRGSERR